ncbi:ABC transporter permease [Flavobacterium ardleyense]|uniref:ABC transporter permease n=1 Tax=Flavobacterium ardleyense TaxID=2038737 RepID=UPI00298C2DE6|nr:ABC transporter permease [Flavobacterium ardleyense]
MIIYLRLVGESFNFALNALRNNKLRTLLSLLGVTIGIFSIIAVLAAVDSLDKKVKGTLSNLDKNTIYYTNVSFGPTEIPRWKSEQFPDVTFEEYQFLKKSLGNTDNVAFKYFTQKENIKYETETVNQITAVPVTYEFLDVQLLEFEEGRFFNESESNSGAQVVVLGYEIAQNLFKNIAPLGKTVRMYGQKFTVIGVVKKQGMGMFGEDNDSSAFFPANFIRRMFGDKSDFVLPVVIIKPEKGADIPALKAELIQKIRSERGLKAGEMDNFFVNVLSGLTDLIDNIVGQMNVVGWIISGFSLLVGGFGIANIMFVSVKERTSLIGIQKALGAKNNFILYQFLFEAVILSLFGGIIGLILVWVIAIVLTNALDFEFVLSFSNILLGTSLAAGIGLISGILPAIAASKLDPVEAIRTGM